MSFSSDDSLIAAADGDTSIRIYNAHSGSMISRNSDLLLEPFTLDFTSDGKQVIAAGADKVVVFIDVNSGRVVRRLPKAAEPVAYLEVSPDGYLLMTAFMKADNMDIPAPVTVWDVTSSQKKRDWMPPARPIGAAWTASSDLLIATNTPEGLHIWRLR